MITQLSLKGQVTLPKAVRDAHHWVSGTQFTIEEQGDGVLLRPAGKLGRTVKIDDVVGCVNYHGPAKTVAEMDDAVAAMARRA